ncbi:MAG TPA: rod shape-determining protein MreC [Phycisphaerales bacterium]|nr:rod shape-determining protein MreC [Phycisphaerales bacterium]
MPGRSQAAFPLTVVATFALAFLPGRWLGWSTSVADVARVPMSPIGFVGTWFANWLRPGVTRHIPTDENAVTKLADDLQYQTEQTQKMLAANLKQALRISDLEQQIAELQMIPAHIREMAGAPISAETPVTSRAANAIDGLVELKIPEEAKDRVTEKSTIAVYGAVNLLGRVTEVSKFRVMLMPITNEATSWFMAAVIPADRIEDATFDMSSAARVQLRPHGDGTLSGEMDRAKDVGKGDKVILSDPSWPEWAQAMVVGIVEKVQPKESEPLIQQVIVRPRVLVSELSHVTLLSGNSAAGEGSH